MAKPPRKQSRKPAPPSPHWRWAISILAMVAGSAGLGLALNYPITPSAACAVFLLACMVFFRWPGAWFVAVPALLPVIGFAPWTGWITFEELDMLVLAAAAGGYARIAWVTEQRPSHARHRGEGSLLAWATVALFALSMLVAMLRGVADAGGWQFGWFQGYREPMNSVRLAKSFFEALLVVPLWLASQRRQPGWPEELIGRGLAGGLAAVALTTIWERAAFTDLLNFSADYRTTGMFWEMHVGGAALDGFLALTVPFALRELLVARTPARWGVGALVMGLGAYACLTTFSRGVYLSAALAIPIFLAIHHRQQQHAAADTGQPIDSGGMGWWPALLLMLGFGVGAIWMFPSSGYRGMAALWGTVALMLPVAHAVHGLRARQWLVAIVISIGAIVVAITCYWVVSKGAYIAWGAAFLTTLAVIVRIQTAARTAWFLAVLALAGFMAAAVGTVLIARHWGETTGLAHATPVVLAVLALFIVSSASKRVFWPPSWRWQAGCVAAMAVGGATIAVFGGGTYMGERFSTGSQDFNQRLVHWELTRHMLDSDMNLMLGKGMGRFPANFAVIGNTHEQPGDYRLKKEGDNRYLTMASSPGINGWGEILRVTQRVDSPGRTPVVTLRVRAAKGAGLHAEVCEKHLLYAERCSIGQIGVTAAPGQWQSVRMELKGSEVGHGAWYAPRLLAFSIAVESRDSVADLDDIALTDAQGRQLLVNGDFSADMSHWFFSSDRLHMPWHAKSLLFNTLFDQGIVGATLLCLLLAAAVWRTTLGTARQHPLAPALATSLIGFTVVGLFDSLLDVPRVAWVFYLLLLIALGIRGQPRAVGSERGHGTAASLALLVLAGGLMWQPQPAMAQQTADVPHQVLRVGPGRVIRTLAAASRIARAGATVEVDAGTYEGDVAVWTQDGLTLRAMGGRVRLRAAGMSAEGKGIWVVRANGVRVEGFDFEGAIVRDRNGAGIRLERGSLLVRDCSFTYNEMGLLTGNDPATVLEVENSEFAHNQRPDGHNHNLYVGRIARFSVTGSYFHHAHVGHLLKSRAALNYVFYNRLTDETGGTASYELEFPNGGVAYVVGNLIQQNQQTDNPHLISFGAEGYKWPRNEIHLVNNTLVNTLEARGVYLRVAPGADALTAVNNLLVGKGNLEAAGPGEYRNNLAASASDFVLADPYDYRLRGSSTLIGHYADPGSVHGQVLQPRFEYVHPRGLLALKEPAHNPGALQRPAATSPP